MMKKSYIPLKNTLISSFGTFLSRITGIIKFNVVNYLFGAGADTFYSANANILSLRKILGEGPLVNSFLPVFSKYKNEDSAKADLFASNIINQLIIISFIVTGIGIIVTPWWTKTFLPGFTNNPQAFQEIVQLTVIMLFSTVFFSIFSIVMGILNAHEKFLSSSTAPILANIIFIVFPLLTYQHLGIMSLAWAVVLGSIAQCIAEAIELYLSGFRYHFYLNLSDQYILSFWKLFFPTALNYLAQSGISIGLGYFASFLPRGSITYLRNANTIMIAPVGFIGVAISGAIFPVFAKVKHDTQQLAEAWSQGVIFFLFTSIPIALFFFIYPDVMVNLIFRDISRFFSGSTGQFTEDLLFQTTNAVQILSTILIPWSLNIMVGKLFYSLEKPNFPLLLILVNFLTNIFGYYLSRVFSWGGIGLVYSDLISGWVTLCTSLLLIAHTLPKTNQYNHTLVKYGVVFTLLSLTIWLGCRPVYYWYLSFNSPLILLILGSLLFIIGISVFLGITHLFRINPITNRKKLRI
ncbi:MAG: lipid II flippase MurJ [Brevinema sp.]